MDVHSPIEMQHEKECPIGLLRAWSRFTASNRLTRRLLLVNANNSVSSLQLKDYLESLGGEELEELLFFATMAENIFLRIRLEIRASQSKRQAESWTAGKQAQPPVIIFSEKANDQTSVSDANGKDESQVPSASDEFSEKVAQYEQLVRWFKRQRFQRDYNKGT
jgi:hypothetical protein